MSVDNGKRNMIGMDQLCIGLHIRLNSWMGHPFLLSSFKIVDQQQIDTLRAMGLKEIEYLPQKSDAKPLTPAPAQEEQEPEDSAVNEADKADLEILMQEKKEKIEALSRERERIRAAERKYLKTASSVKNVMRLANQQPQHAAQLAGEVANDLAEIFLADSNPYIHLMGDNITDENAYYHGLNVTVLSLILAKAVGTDDPETMRDIAQGAVLHDAGKAMIPSQIMMKDEELTPAEMKLMQMHPGYGIKLMQSVETLPNRVRSIILFHHEMNDGSGYPKGLKGEEIDAAVRIVTIANTYDNLCNPRVVKRARTPAEALTFMYKNNLVKFDKAILSAFIKSLGIYPPGTIVKLKSGRVGIVMSVDSSDLLYPNLMLFDPAVPKDDAAIVNLKHDLADAVETTLRPSSLPEAVHDYLSPRKRVCYFVDSGSR